MLGTASIFLDVHLPNSTTWFYLAVILGIAIFFRFQRPWKLRNWDLVMLFILVPPLLMLREGHTLRDQHEAIWREEGRKVTLLLATAGHELARPVLHAPSAALVLALAEPPPKLATIANGFPERQIWRSYLWLLIGSAYWLVRCLVDLLLRKRVPFVSNLSLGGLAWLALALFLIMSTWTFLPRGEAAEPQSQNLVVEKSARLVSALLQSQWSSTDAKTLEAILALLCHGVILLALFWIGMQHYQDSTTGMAAVVLYLVLPYTAFQLTNLEQVFPAMLLTLAMAAYRLPLVSGTLVGTAVASSFFPVVLLPVWISFYWRRGVWRFLAPMGLLLLFLGAMIWLDGDLKRGFFQALDRPEWQPWYYGERPLAEGLWTGFSLHFAYRLPLFLGFVLLVVGSFFWPAPKDLGHLLAWNIALLLGIQFWYADAGGIYILWYLPLLVLLTLKPTLAERRPPELEPDRDWLVQSARWLGRRLRGRRGEKEPHPSIKTLAHRKAG